jgi:hypothetical protein
MTIKERIKLLANNNSKACVTISLNTHKTHPDNLQDEILLKKLLKEAEERVISEFGKREVPELLVKIQSVASSIDVNYNLDSLHLFLSEEVEEVIRLPWPARVNEVHVGAGFSLRPIIKAYNRTQHYLVMLLSQSGVNVYEALNDTISSEVINDEFPFGENTHFETEAVRRSDSKHVDNLVREFLNKVDKALVKLHIETGLHCVVICTEDNYSRLMQVTDRPHAYMGFANVDYNSIKTHQLAKQSYEIVKDYQLNRRLQAIEEMKEAVGQGNVLTDLQEIYQAALDGRGELLIVHQDFAQAVMMKDERTFELITDPSLPNAIDDITSVIAWQVISKNGRVVFTVQDSLKDLGEIVLKTRY